MRPLEVVLVAVEALALVWLAALPPRLPRWAGLLCPVAAGCAVTQALIEGSRWQLVPAYILAAVVAIAWLGQVVARERPRKHRPVAGSLRGFGVGMGALLLGIAVGLPIALPVFSFDVPTGSYAIGTLTYRWVDRSRPEIFTADHRDHRQVVAQVWYPAEPSPSAPRAPYIQDAHTVTPALAQVARVPSFTFAHFRYVATHAVSSAPVAAKRRRYPVILFSSGLGGFRQSNTAQVEQLVSHGYVVVGLDQPGAQAVVGLAHGRRITMPPRSVMQPLIRQSIVRSRPAPTLHGLPMTDGIIPYLAQDLRFTLDELEVVDRSDPRGILTNRLDLGRVGAFGVSLGGMNVAEACVHDDRIKAFVAMDVWLPADVTRSPLRTPSMFLTRDAATMRLERARSGGWTEDDIRLTLGTMRKAYEQASARSYHVSIPGMFHVNFTDAPLWSPLTSRLGLTGPIDRRRGPALVNAYLLAFFDQNLLHRSPTLLDGPPGDFPEVRFESNHH